MTNVRGVTLTRVFAAVLGLAAAGACDKSPVEPFEGVKKLEVTGPATAVPGQTVRYVATAHYADGTTRNVTPDVTWLAVGAPLSFTSPGVATAGLMGEGNFNATFHVFKVQMHVLVLNSGTFKLSGSIRERGGSTVGFGAKVVVLSGVGQGRQATGSNYNLYGVAGPIRLGVSGVGYFPIEHEIDVTGHVVQDFELVPLETTADVAGDWTLTLGPPPPGCPAGLPAMAETRSYNMAVIQKGREIELQLRGPTVQVANDGLTAGSIFGQRVTLWADNPQDDFGVEQSINLIDKLSATETFSFTGRIEFQGNESPIVTSMNFGRIRYWSRPVTQDPSWECKATNYPVTLRR